MAVYGLQNDFINKVLKDYFGSSELVITRNEIFVGLGLTQSGSQVNSEDFTEVFAGRPYGNYKRSRAVFGHSVDGVLSNLNEVIFNTASEDWTENDKQIEMIGLFTTKDYEDSDGNLIKPVAVLRLPQFETVLTGETILLATNSIQLTLSDI